VFTRWGMTAPVSQLVVSSVIAHMSQIAQGVRWFIVYLLDGVGFGVRGMEWGAWDYGSKRLNGLSHTHTWIHFNVVKCPCGTLDRGKHGNRRKLSPMLCIVWEKGISLMLRPDMYGHGVSKALLLVTHHHPLAHFLCHSDGGF
jgi:hypothetical protein